MIGLLAMCNVLIITVIYTKKSLSRERSNSVAQVVVPSFQCFLTQGVGTANFFSQLSSASQMTDY